MDETSFFVTVAFCYFNQQSAIIQNNTLQRDDQVVCEMGQDRRSRYTPVRTVVIDLQTTDPVLLVDTVKRKIVFDVFEVDDLK